MCYRPQMFLVRFIRILTDTGLDYGRLPDIVSEIFQQTHALAPHALIRLKLCDGSVDVTCCKEQDRFNYKQRLPLNRKSRVLNLVLIDLNQTYRTLNRLIRV